MEQLFKSWLERYRQQVGLTLVFLILIGGGVLAFSGGSGPKKEEITVVKGQKTEVAEGTAAAEAVAPLPALITVEVAGAVLKPGVYQLSAADRVVEALDQAGGLSEQADKDWVAKNLNLAAKLSDGDKIYIPTTGERLGQAAAGAGISTSDDSSSCSRVNINTASAAALDECLTGIGPTYAQRIVEYRQAHGGFKTMEEIQNVSGIGPKTFAKIKDQITVD